MTEFQYSGVNRDGAACDGFIRGQSVDSVRLRLLSQGVQPLSIRIADETAIAAKSDAAKRCGLSAGDILQFTREMAHLKQSNMPLDKAIVILKEVAAGDEMLKFIEQIEVSVRSGKSLYQSLLPFERDLGRQYLTMVRAGEAAGSLGVVLKELSIQQEVNAKLQSYLISALTYPFILMTVSVASVFMLLIFVVPQFRDIFDAMGDALPFSTKLVLQFSDLIRSYWVGIIILGSGLFLIFMRWISSEAGRIGWDGMVLRIPLLGKVIQNLQFAVYFRTLGMLLQRGIPLVDSLNIALDAITNTVLRVEAAPVVDVVKSGKRLSDGFGSAHFGHRGTAQLIRVAEESGQLEQTLLSLGERFEDESRRTMTRVLSAIEPLIIVSLGAVVAFIIIAILGGVLSINETI